jgi:hypothetical protein
VQLHAGNQTLDYLAPWSEEKGIAAVEDWEPAIVSIIPKAEAVAQRIREAQAKAAASKERVTVRDETAQAAQTAKPASAFDVRLPEEVAADRAAERKAAREARDRELDEAIARRKQEREAAARQRSPFRVTPAPEPAKWKTLDEEAALERKRLLKRSDEE